MKKLIKQIFKFAIVGVIAFIIDTLLFALLNHLGMHYLLSQIISFTVSLCFNYVASIKWVFSAKKQTVKEVFIFVLLSVIGLIINEWLLYLGVDVLGYNTEIGKIIVKVIATCYVMVYNFITRKLIIEKH